MPKITIKQDRCKGCELCIITCPRCLIRFDKRLNVLGYYPATFNGADRCTGCGFCAMVCPDCCIEVYK